MNLAVYNTVQSAADFADLRTAMGYEQINLNGVSYGTRLALTIVRAYIVAGYPAQALPALGSYGEWTRLVRAPLTWLANFCPKPAYVTPDSVHPASAR